MKKNIIALAYIIIMIFYVSANAANLPSGFVYLRNVDPSILQDIRYAGYHNFIGRPIEGYRAAECILTKPAAQALIKVQAELKKSNLSLKVYDCYRPQAGVDDFIIWGYKKRAQQMKAEFYPRADKSKLFELEYIAGRSKHTYGSTIDLTMVPIPAPQQPNYRPGQKLIACIAPYGTRFKDNSVDMGTGFDCMDELSQPDNKAVSKTAYANRMLLARVMKKYGFAGYQREWWHFTLKNEPYPEHYFNFPVQ